MYLNSFQLESRGDDAAPTGCVKERLSEFAPRTILEHEEFAHALNSDGKGGHIPFQLQKLLENIKNGYLKFLDTMKVRVKYILQLE